jgi:hypothetical protein
MFKIIIKEEPYDLKHKNLFDAVPKQIHIMK